MVDDIPASTVRVAADVLDAIDPALDRNVQEDAAMRAVDADPFAAVGMLATLLRETYEALGEATGVPAESLVRDLRRRLGARLVGEEP